MSELYPTNETQETQLKEIYSFSPTEKELIGHAIDGEIKRSLEKLDLCFEREPSSLTPDEAALKQEYGKELLHAAESESLYFGDEPLSEEDLMLNAKENLNVHIDELEMLADKLPQGDNNPLTADMLSDGDLMLTVQSIYGECKVGDTARNTYTPEHDVPSPILAYESLGERLVAIYNERYTEEDETDGVLAPIPDDDDGSRGSRVREYVAGSKVENAEDNETPSADPDNKQVTSHFETPLGRYEQELTTNKDGEAEKSPESTEGKKPMEVKKSEDTSDPSKLNPEPTESTLKKTLASVAQEVVRPASESNEEKPKNPPLDFSAAFRHMYGGR